MYDEDDAAEKSAAQLLHETQTLAASISEIEPKKRKKIDYTKENIFLLYSIPIINTNAEMKIILLTNIFFSSKSFLLLFYKNF